MSAQTVAVQFDDGRIVDGAELRGELSADIFQRQEHYDLAGAFARAAGAPADVELVLHNLLAMKSLLLRDISAALFIFDHNPVGVRKISVAPNIAKVLAKFAPQAPVVEMPGGNAELISRKTALMTIAKAIAHRLYRLRRRPYVAGRAVVRAWVDVTLKMYAREVASAQVRVFPFPLNRRRQKDFLDELERQGIDWARDGLPYRLSAFVGLLVADSTLRPLAIAKFEHDAFTDFASEVVRGGSGPVYTSDEFEVGAVSAGHAFRVSGTQYINSAHGVGLYCPCTAYSHFRFLTKSQEDFYRQSSPQTHFSRRETANFALALTTSRNDDLASVVFVHQDFRSAGLQAEAHVEDRIISCLDELELPAHVSKYVKIHPNSDPVFVGNGVSNCKVVTKWSDIRSNRCLFVLINSTAFYDLDGSGSVSVFKDFSFTPEVYLEGSYNYFNVESFPRVVQDWIKSNGGARL